MFRASGSFGGHFYVENTMQARQQGRPPAIKKNNNTVAKNPPAPKINLKQEEAYLAKMRREQEAMKKKIAKEEEARLARMRKEDAAMERKIQKQQEEIRRKQNQQIKAANQQRTRPQGVRKKEEIIVRKKVTTKQNVVVRRHYY